LHLHNISYIVFAIDYYYHTLFSIIRHIVVFRIERVDDKTHIVQLGGTLSSSYEPVTYVEVRVGDLKLEQ